MAEQQKKKRGRPAKPYNERGSSKVKLVEDLSFDHGECAMLWQGLQTRLMVLKMQREQAVRGRESEMDIENIDSLIDRVEKLIDKITMHGSIFY